MFAKSLSLLFTTSVVVCLTAVLVYFTPLREPALHIFSQAGVKLSSLTFGQNPQQKDVGVESRPKSKEELTGVKIDVRQFLGADGDAMFTKEELKQYDGSAGSPGLYLAIVGSVFDVSKGDRHYGPGGGYSFFAATDGTKAYVTGEFNEKGLVDDTSGIELGQALELEDWINFYHSEYTYKGKVIGNFFDEMGQPREALKFFFQQLQDARAEKENQDADLKKFPPCNSSFKKGEYRKVWCTEKSGGVQRNFVGYPRKYFARGRSTPRCACVDDRYLESPLIKQYEGCDERARSCDLPL